MPILIIILILTSIVLSLLGFFAKTGDFAVFLSLLAAPIVLSVYFDNPKVSKTVLAVASVWSAVYLIYAEKFYLLGSLIAVFFVLYALTKRKKEESLKEKEELIEETKRKENRRSKLVVDADKMKGYSKDVDKQTEELENLYEITKHMSAYLKLDEVVDLLSTELKNDFEFDDCRLIDVEQIKKEIQVKEAYDIVTEKKTKKAKYYDPKIIGEVSEQRALLQITEDTAKEKKDQLNLPDNVVTLLAIPIIIDDKLQTVVIVENILKDSFEKFSTVIGQFGLQMRKVKLYQTIQRLSEIDSLTNLLLRRNFMQALQEELERAKAHDLKIAVLMIDIDHFKKLNDTYGHLAGDKVLEVLAGIIEKNTRRIDLCCRYGGEEFAVALAETGQKGAKIVAGRIKDQVENENFKVDSKTVSTTVSIGLAFYPDDSKEIIELIDLSDKALYKAKQGGRNRICVYSKKEKK
jgi:diguanylate cyclase (GGDEF)-like protein